MTLLRLTAAAVILDGDDLTAVRYAVQVTQRARARNGLPPSVGLARLAAALATPGQPDSSSEPVGETDTMTIHEAAALLGCSPRTARRKAPQLGGRRVAGVWLLDRQAVTEHTEGATA